MNYEIMEVLIKVMQLILSLSLLVFVHELGHYLTARMFGIRVEKFYLFFDAWGFSFFKFKIGETTFGLGWVPFGGYCKISGMIDESMDTEQMKQPPQPWEFRSKPAWQRLIVMVGGVVMNVVTAIVIYIGMSWQWGDSYVDNEDIKWGYAFNELGREAGFVDGDRIVSFDGEPVSGPFQTVYTDMVIGQVKRVAVIRDGAPVEVSIPEDMTARMLNSEDFMMPRMPAVIGEVAPETTTQLQVGDSLVAFNGVPIRFINELDRAINAMPENSAFSYTVMRDSLGVKVPRIVPGRILSGEQPGVKFKGLAAFFHVSTREYTFAEAIPAGFRHAGEQISSYWQQLKLIFSPKTEAYKSVGSLITIGSIFPGEWDWIRFWSVTAFLSIILAVMNILPIPALDGGHVVFLVWEVVTRRRPSDKVLERAQMVGMILLLGLMVLAFWNDIYRFFIK